MIKLIATDVDDTLLPNATPVITPEIEDMIRRLRQQDILFVAATGRQYIGTRKTFSNIEDQVIYICENGAEVYLPGHEPIKKFIPPEYVWGVIQDYRRARGGTENWNGMDFMISTSRGVFIEHPTEEFEYLIGQRMNYDYQVIDCFENMDTDEDILKISFYAENGVDAIASELIPKWRDRVNICQAGKTWLPTMNIQADKGIAVARLAQMYDIRPEEMMAFGDGGNDIGMFRQAAYSYAAGNAEDFVKEQATGIFEPAVDNGVYKVIMKKIFGEEIPLGNRGR